MAVGVREGNEQVAGANFLRTGATLVKVITVAPTIDEMKTLLGFEDPKEQRSPVDTNETGKARIRMDVWVGRPEEEFKTKLAFFLVNFSRRKS